VFIAAILFLKLPLREENRRVQFLIAAGHSFLT
jgi:hypothetical protein